MILGVFSDLSGSVILISPGCAADSMAQCGCTGRAAQLPLVLLRCSEGPTVGSGTAGGEEQGAGLSPSQQDGWALALVTN